MIFPPTVTPQGPEWLQQCSEQSLLTTSDDPKTTTEPATTEPTTTEPTTTKTQVQNTPCKYIYICLHNDRRDTL